MSKKNDCWGIEVGSHAIKAIRLVRSGDKVTVADYDILPFKKILTTPDLNVDEAIQLNLDQFLSKRSVSRSSVVVSVPGNAAFARFAKLPPVEPKRIPDIVKFEAVQQIPFPIDQVEWDYQVFSQPDSPDVEVGIFAIMRERVNQYLANYRAVGLEVDAVTLSPLAVFNALSYDLELDENSPGVIFMDIGTSITDVIVVEEGKLWLRTLSKGGNNFTEALVRAFKLSTTKAEKLKREAGTSKYARQIFSAMRPVFADLVQEMQRSLGFYQSLNRDADLTKIIGVGSTFRLPGMQKFLKQQLQLDVSRPDGFNRLEVDSKIAADFSEHAISMVTAYGLAIQGLGLARVEANIMPVSILKQRNWRSKQPWMMATAALFVAASCLAYGKLWTQQQNVASEQMSTSNTAQQVVGRAQAFVKDFNEVESSANDPRQKINNLRRILDYRDLWPKLMYDLDQASKSLEPQPPLMTADYQQISQIPRDQRRRVYIDKISTKYRFGADSGSAAPSAETQAMSFDDIWGAAADPAPVPDMPDAPVTPTPTPTSGGPQNFSPPSFEVTIEGTTPYADGPRLVIEHFVQWFRQNGKLGGRPYVIDEKSVVSGAMSKVGGATAEPVDVRPTRPGSVFGNNRANNTTPVGGGDAIPESPLAGELKGGDWRFSCKFVVQLVRPEDARKAEKTDLNTKTPPAGAPATSSNTTPEVQP